MTRGTRTHIRFTGCGPTDRRTSPLLARILVLERCSGEGGLPDDANTELSISLPCATSRADGRAHSLSGGCIGSATSVPCYDAVLCWQITKPLVPAAKITHRSGPTAVRLIAAGCSIEGSEAAGTEVGGAGPLRGGRRGEVTSSGHDTRAQIAHSPGAHIGLVRAIACSKRGVLSRARLYIALWGLKLRRGLWWIHRAGLWGRFDSGTKFRGGRSHELSPDPGR